VGGYGFEQCSHEVAAADIDEAVALAKHSARDCERLCEGERLRRQAAQKGFKDNTLTGATRHPRLPTPPQHTLTFCAPHARPLQPTAVAYVSYGFVLWSLWS
jgi:hypothetical protein